MNNAGILRDKSFKRWHWIGTCAQSTYRDPCGLAAYERARLRPDCVPVQSGIYGTRQTNMALPKWACWACECTGAGGREKTTFSETLRRGYSHDCYDPRAVQATTRPQSCQPAVLMTSKTLQMARSQAAASSTERKSAPTILWTWVSMQRSNH